MKRKLGWLLVLVAVLVLAAYGVMTLAHAPPASTKSTPLATVPIRPSSPSFLMRAIARAQQRIVFDEQMRQIKERSAELRARMAKTAVKISPEMRRQSRDRIILRREPKYRELFETWDLDATTVDKVLAVIRERETRIHEALYTSMESGAPTDYVDTKRMEQRRAAGQIIDLVGDDHYAELAQMESGIAAEELAKGRELYNNHAKPPLPAPKL